MPDNIDRFVAGKHRGRLPANEIRRIEITQPVEVQCSTDLAAGTCNHGDVLHVFSDGESGSVDDIHRTGMNCRVDHGSDGQNDSEDALTVGE